MMGDSARGQEISDSGADDDLAAEDSEEHLELPPR